jgi:hypothetical protein
MSNQVTLKRLKDGFRGFATATHFTEPDQTFISFDFNDRPHEPSPVTAVRMAQRRLERNSHSRRA